MRGTGPRASGFALVALIPLILVGLMAWSAAYRSFGPVLQLEERAALTATEQPLSGPVLSRGLYLLSEGRPPSDPYICRRTVVWEGVAIERQLRFRHLGDDSWLLSVHPTIGPEPPCPARFATK